jgi:hypothetical protein
MSYPLVFSCWEVNTCTQLWRIVPVHSHRHMYVFCIVTTASVFTMCEGRGFSALSPDKRMLLISNLSKGMDLYRLARSQPLYTYQYEPDAARNYPLAVSFLQEGRAVICGAPRGDVHIWNTTTEEHQQTLFHNGSYHAGHFMCRKSDGKIGDLIQAICVSIHRL